MQVLVKVKVEFHTAYGFSLVLHDIDQSFTLGNIEKQRRETLLKLVAENPSFIHKVGEEYITANKKLKLNTVIQNIAIIGSPNSEGYTDFTHTISNNKFGYKFSIDIYQSSVQGAEAEKELINKLIAIYNSNKKYECVVIIRGGGAKTDFLVFDTYNLSRAVAKFPIPIITGIGHHKDVSIVDLMVSVSTKTPTKAAEFIISHNHDFEDSVLLLQKAVVIKSQQLLSNSQQKLNACNLIILNKSRTFISHYKDQLTNFNQVIINKTKTILYNRQTNLISLLNQLLSKPQILTANKTSDLNNLISNLKIFSSKYYINQRGYIGHYVSIVKLMSPKNILKKGFAIVSHNGKILKSADAINPGNDLVITMEKYDVNTKVISKTKKDGEYNL
ncbi:MAG: Exodeoxyribonuclease 7 large subunit [Bacteroidia bacterium]|nr:Exodeoxyribonuclease 7 large subunit [Bacteroidia bacterium]